MQRLFFLRHLHPGKTSLWGSPHGGGHGVDAHANLLQHSDGLGRRHGLDLVDLTGREDNRGRGTSGRERQRRFHLCACAGASGLSFTLLDTTLTKDWMLSGSSWAAGWGRCGSGDGVSRRRRCGSGSRSPCCSDRLLHHTAHSQRRVRVLEGVGEKGAANRPIICIHVPCKFRALLPIGRRFEPRTDVARLTRCPARSPCAPASRQATARTAISLRAISPAVPRSCCEDATKQDRGEPIGASCRPAAPAPSAACPPPATSDRAL